MEKSAIKLRIVFMGSRSFAGLILKNILDREFNVVGIFTRPDSKKTSGEDDISPVKKIAVEKNIPVFQHMKIDDDFIAEVKKLKPDIIIVAAYGKILPKEILDIPGFGCFNIHPSLLPKYRGPSPIQNALLCGEKETGVTVILMNEGIDTGMIFGQEKMAIGADDTYLDLLEKLAKRGSEILMQTLPLWIEKKIEPKKQDDSCATVCQLIEREDGRIIWEEDAYAIYNKYRAFYAWPGIYTFWKRSGNLERLKLIDIDLQRVDPETPHKVGEVFELADKIGVQTIRGVIIINALQLEGKNVTPIKDFINGYPNFIGSVLC